MHSRRTIYLLIFITSISFIEVSAQESKVDSLLKLLRKETVDTSKVNLLNLLSSNLILQTNWDSAAKYALEAKNIAEKINFKKGLARSLHSLGMISRGDGDYNAGIEYSSQSLKIARQLNDSINMPSCYSNIALSYQYQGNYLEAMKNWIQALQIDERNGNKKSLGSDYLNIGTFYTIQENYDEALKNNYKALNIFKQINDTNKIAMCYVNIGLTYYNRHDPDAALENYHLGLKIQKKTGDRSPMGNTYNDIGVIYSEKGVYKEALKNYLLALDIYREFNDKRRTTISYINIASIYRKIKQFSKSRQYLDQAFTMAQEIGAKGLLKECYETYAELNEATGNYQEAYKYQKLSSKMKDTLLNEKNNKQIAELKTKYETEKKDKEIVMLNKDKELLNKDNEIQAVKIDKQKSTVRYIIAVVVLLGMFAWISSYLNNKKKKATFLQQVTETKLKALRAQMNPHFIYNSINSVYRYMQENDMKSAEGYLLSFSKLIRQVLENSLQNEVSLNEELRSLELYLALEAQRMNNKFIYKINVADDIDRENTLVPPLLMEPFVENSIWHGLKNKEGQGKIAINITKDGEMLKCVIEDNGVGRHQNVIKTTQEKEKKQSLGMKLTKDRIETMNQNGASKATVSIIDLFDESKKPAGVKVELSLPLVLEG